MRKYEALSLYICPQAYSILPNKYDLLRVPDPFSLSAFEY